MGALNPLGCHQGDVDMLRTDALLQINSKVKKDAESQSAAGGSGVLADGAAEQSSPPQPSIFLSDVAARSRDTPGTSAQPSDAQQHVAADAPASQVCRVRDRKPDPTS
jgi:hypothetical protein